MIYIDENPVIGDPSQFNHIQFYQTAETLMDPDEYTKFIYSIENQFKRSRFYRDYKSYIYNQDLGYDQFMRNINSGMADIELHHHLPTLKDATIVICEYYLQTLGKVCTFDAIKSLEEAHRQNMMGVVMLTTTNHQKQRIDPTVFISISQLRGYPFKFLDVYGKHFTAEIAYKWLLQFRQEEQYGNKSMWSSIARARDQIINWSNSGYINS